ncbi:MAG: thiamine diphosphokinase [Eubacterium sp.]|nr:thiamine diphosphokinase [Eubacterium sp.]
MEIIIVACGNVNKDQLINLYKSIEDPFVIGVDRGTLTAMEAGLPISLSVGDYDSLLEGEDKKLSQLDNKQVLNPIKDDSDTEHSLRMAIDMKPDRIYMIGVTGGRLDHELSCIRMLRLAAEEEIEAYILDEKNRIRVARGEVEISKNISFYYRDGDYKRHYVSVLPYGDQLRDLTEKGFKYEIENFRLAADNSRGVSNELKQEKGIISCQDYMIIMETRD